MADRLAGGELAYKMGQWRTAGVGDELISRRLFADFGIEVTRQTVGTWLDALGVAKPQPQDAA